MTKYAVVGVEKLDYVSKKSNKPVRGFRVHCTFADSSIEGFGVEKVYFPEGSCASAPKLRDTINIFYNQYGRPCGWAPAQ